MWSELSNWRDWHLEYWAPLASGVLAALLVLIVARLIYRRRRLIHFSPPASPRGRASPEADPFIHGSAMERRKALRRGGNPVSVLLTEAEQKGKPLDGWVVDRSTGGLCLSVPNAIEPGTILGVRTSDAPQSVPWVQLEVKNCREADIGWELGCQFVRTPPWSVLLLFG